MEKEEETNRQDRGVMAHKYAIKNTRKLIKFLKSCCEPCRQKIIRSGLTEVRHQAPGGLRDDGMKHTLEEGLCEDCQQRYQRLL